jgi:hypothetical protein
MKKLPIFLLTVIIYSNTLAQKQASKLHELNSLLINTVMQDLFNPPVASRIYVYPNIAFYECIATNKNQLQSLSGKLNGLKPLPKPTNEIDNVIAACISFCYTAQALVATENKFEEWRNEYTKTTKLLLDSAIWINSFNYGKQIADSILAYSKTDNYLKWIHYNNMNLKEYYERNTSFKDPDKIMNFILKFNEYLLYIININRFNLSYFYNNLENLYYIETAKKNKDYKKQFEYTKGTINMNNKYYKKHKNPVIKLSITVVNKKTEIKKILDTENNEIEIINKNFEINYKGHYYEEKNYKIFHGNGILIIKENNNILWYCIGIFENGWIKKGLIYYYNSAKFDTVEYYQYDIYNINKDKLLTLKFNLDNEKLKYKYNEASFYEYESLLKFKFKSQKITNVSIIEEDIKEIINEHPELKKLLSFTEPFNKGGKRRKTTKRNRYKKRKLRTKKRK